MTWVMTWTTSAAIRNFSSANRFLSASQSWMVRLWLRNNSLNLTRCFCTNDATTSDIVLVTVTVSSDKIVAQWLQPDGRSWLLMSRVGFCRQEDRPHFLGHHVRFVGQRTLQNASFSTKFLSWRQIFYLNCPLASFPMSIILNNN